MAAVPKPPYFPDLAPCYICLFPKMKLNLKGHRFVTIEEIQAESSRVHNTLTGKNFQKPSENGRDDGTDVYMRERTTSRVMAADRPYCEFYNLYIVSPEYCG
jgi:hypothetical protein